MNFDGLGVRGSWEGGRGASPSSARGNRISKRGGPLRFRRLPRGNKQHPGIIAYRGKREAKRIISIDLEEVKLSTSSKDLVMNGRARPCRKDPHPRDCRQSRWSSQDRERSQAAEPKTDGPLPPELAEHRLKYYQCLRYVQGGTDWIFQLVQFS